MVSMRNKSIELLIIRDCGVNRVDVDQWSQKSCCGPVGSKKLLETIGVSRVAVKCGPMESVDFLWSW